MANRAPRRVATVALALGLLGGAPATFAAAAGDDYVGRTPPTIPPTTVAAKVLGTVQTRAMSDPIPITEGDPIPVTGGDVAGLAAIGAAAVASGVLLVRRGRRAPR